MLSHHKSSLKAEYLDTSLVSIALTKWTGWFWTKFNIVAIIFNGNTVKNTPTLHPPPKKKNNDLVETGNWNISIRLNLMATFGRQDKKIQIS